METTTQLYSEQIKDLLRLFSYQHLPKHLQVVSKPFSELAHEVAGMSFANLHIVMCLEDLLKAKDSAVRAYVASRPVAKKSHK